MPFDESKPLITTALICEKVLQEGNIFSAIRIVDTYTVKLMPVGVLLSRKPGEPPPEAQVIQTNQVQVLDMSALVMLRAGSVRGKHELSITVESPTGEIRPFPDKMPVEFKLGDPAEVAVLSMKFILPSNAPTGRYWVNVLWDDEILTKIPVKLHREESESQATLSVK